jgi:hypothetical protein
MWGKKKRLHIVCRKLRFSCAVHNAGNFLRRSVQWEDQDSMRSFPRDRILDLKASTSKFGLLSNWRRSWTIHLGTTFSVWQSDRHAWGWKSLARLDKFSKYSVGHRNVLSILEFCWFSQPNEPQETALKWAIKCWGGDNRNNRFGLLDLRVRDDIQIRPRVTGLNGWRREKGVDGHISIQCFVIQSKWFEVELCLFESSDVFEVAQGWTPSIVVLPARAVSSRGRFRD